MVTSPYEWIIPEWDDKLQTTKKKKIFDDNNLYHLFVNNISRHAHAEGQVFQSKLWKTHVKTSSHSFNIKYSANCVNIQDLKIELKSDVPLSIQRNGLERLSALQAKFQVIKPRGSYYQIFIAFEFLSFKDWNDMAWMNYSAL